MLRFFRGRKVRTGTLFLFLLLFIHTVANLWGRPNPALQHNSEVTGFKDIKRVYIASILSNSEAVLEHSVPELLHLLQKLRSLGTEAYVSFYENGSTDRTKAILLELDLSLQNLNVNRTITLDEETKEGFISEYKGQTGVLSTSHGQKLRRISRLADLRNRPLEPLSTLAGEGIIFDRVIWINDVVFRVGKPCPLRTALNIS